MQLKRKATLSEKSNITDVNSKIDIVQSKIDLIKNDLYNANLSIEYAGSTLNRHVSEVEDEKIHFTNTQEKAVYADKYTKAETINLLSAKADTASPSFTGEPTAPSPSISDNSTRIATTAYVTSKVSSSGGGGSSSTIVNDTLTSTSTSEALSANMGRALNENKADKTLATKTASGLMAKEDKSKTESIYIDNQSTAIGCNGFKDMPNSSGNTSIGANTLQKNNGGQINTAVGISALESNTTGVDNVAVGAYALRNSNGKYNTATGTYALQNNTTGLYNTATGYESMKLNNMGSFNVAVGFGSLYTNGSSDNVAVGRNALRNSSTGSQTAVGSGALFSNTTGSNNTALGFNALSLNATGTCNTAVGLYALEKNTNNYNTATGFYSLRNNTGYGNSAFGNEALNFNSSGFSNTAVGSSCMRTNHIGNQNTAIGSGALNNSNYNYYSNVIAVGYDCPSYGSNTAHIGNSGVESISFGAGTSTSFTNRSDPRTKEGIVYADLKTCLNDIKRLKLRRFRYKDFVRSDRDSVVTGFLSTEFIEVFPKAVFKKNCFFQEKDIETGEDLYEEIEIERKSTDPETGEEKIETETFRQAKMIEIKDCESIDQTQVIPTLVGAVKALIEEVETLKAMFKT